VGVLLRHMESRIRAVDTAKPLVVRTDQVVDTGHVLRVDTGSMLDHSRQAAEVELVVPVSVDSSILEDCRLGKPRCCA